jgi:plastocyanin domain-containing protein
MRSQFVRIVSLSAVLLGVGCGNSSASAGPLANDVVMTVTDKGFEPPNIRVRKGEPVKLTITRTSDATCATEIIVDDHVAKTPLPLNKAVVVSFTPKKTGALKYGCAMQKMIGGVITVE